MSNKNVTLKDENGNILYPKTLTSRVINTNNQNLDTLLGLKADAASAVTSVTVGTTTTGAAGSNASVTNSGTATAPVLNFTIPQGAKGDTGATGATGPQGERGPQGDTGVTVEAINSIIHSIDPATTYGADDVAGADAVQDIQEELTELAGELEIHTTTQLNFSTVGGVTVRRYSPFAVVTGLTATFYCAYIEIDNTMETVRVTSTDNKAYSLIQGIYLFSSIPASEGNADSQLDYVEFTNTGTTYQKDIPITPEMYGKYLVVTSHTDCNLQIFNITTENKIAKINEDLDALANDISELRQDDSALEERIETIEEKLTENVSDLLTYTTISESTVRKSDRKLLGNLSTNYRTVYLLIDGSYTSYRIKSTDNINYQNIQGVYLFSDTPAVNGFGDAQLDFVDFTNSGSEVDRTIPVDQSMTGKYLAVTTHANCNLQIYGLLQRDKFDYLESQIEENQEQDDIRYVQLSSAIQKYPKEGVNLIELENIQANKMVDSNGNFKSYNGWRGVEIDFCSTDTPIYFNLIYSGYYSLLDASGNVVKVVQTSGRDLYSGYKLPSGVVKGRFSINSDISDSDISTYAYISYGRPLMQDEVNVRVGFEASYSMNKSERPTDYDGGDICAFEKILCIGDSITDGAFNYTAISGQTFTAREALSYPSNLASITGRTVINLGDSGESPSSWWAAHQNDAELTGVDCAIIELGINGSNDELNTDTKTAFDSIISALKTRNQKIKIFISSIPTGKAYRAQLSSDTYYQKDQWLRTYYDTYYANDNQVFFLDVARYGHLRDKYSSGNYDDYNEGHLSAYGYWRLAMDYRNYISYIMKNSNSDFKNIQFTGTDFEFQ